MKNDIISCVYVVYIVRCLRMYIKIEGRKWGDDDDDGKITQ